MTFNNVDLYEEFGSDEYGESYFLVNNVTGRGVMDVEAEGITATQMDGVYPSFSRYKERILEVDFTLKGEDFEDLRKKLERLNEIFSTNGDEVPIEFDDEPNRVYRGRLTSAEDSMENGRIYQASITITCGNPHKRGKEPYEKDFEDDSIIVENEGTALAEPVFELTAKEKATFAMVANGANEDSYYNLIGVPADVDEVLVDDKSAVFTEIGETINEWDTPSGFQGSFANDDAGIYVNSYGTGDGWHGPGLIREIDPIKDFEIEFYTRVRTERPEMTFRNSLNFFDENMNELGLLRLWNKTTNQINKVVEARIGPYVGKFENYLISSDNYSWIGQRAYNGIIRVTRKGNEFTFYAAHISQRGNHIETITKRYVDSGNEYDGKLKYIRIDAAIYGDNPKPNALSISRIKVSEHNEVLEDQTPYIIYPGDLVTFDHEDDEILINGEPRDDLKNFGGTFFPLHKGTNEILVYPDDTFDTKVRFENKYL